MARSGVSIRITGMEGLKTKLEDLPDEVKAALRKAVRESAEAVRDDTKNAVRVDTGNLRDSVDIRYDNDGLTAEVGWFDDEDFYAAFHEYGTRRFPAQPALAPAVEAERGRMRARITEEVRRHLR